VFHLVSFPIWTEPQAVKLFKQLVYIGRKLKTLIYHNFNSRIEAIISEKKLY